MCTGVMGTPTVPFWVPGLVMIIVLPVVPGLMT
jgi:hypothetical protein